MSKYIYNYKRKEEDGTKYKIIVAKRHTNKPPQGRTPQNPTGGVETHPLVPKGNKEHQKKKQKKEHQKPS
jgi:hypothetical protein